MVSLKPLFSGPPKVAGSNSQYLEKENWPLHGYI